METSTVGTNKCVAMIRAVVFLSLMLLPAQGWTQELSVQGLQPLQNELLDFQSNGCTGWFDAFGDKDYTNCCLDHDFSYWTGGTQADKSRVDRDLKQCVSRIAGPLMGNLMFSVVWLWGKIDTIDGTRWGFGWKYFRNKDLELSENEKAQAIEKTPRELRSALIKYWSKEKKKGKLSYMAETYPTLTGNYCLDEVASQLALASFQNGIKHLRLSYKVSPNFISSYTISSNLCDGVIMARFDTLQYCREPHYSLKLTDFLISLIGFRNCKQFTNP